MNNKSVLRRQISAQKRAMSDEQIQQASQRLADRLFETDLYKNAQSIYGYLSYNQEVRTDPILRRAMLDGKRVAVPKVFGDDMKFLWIEDLSLVTPGFYNIPEPIADEPEADDELALVLMPGLAFDSAGHRIGYGGGFYDRYLSAHPYHKLVALCYHFQLLDCVEVEAHDVPVDLVIADMH